MTVAERVREKITDPALFAEKVLGHDVWDTPADIMRAVDQPRARVAVKACHASSKTFTAAEIALWFVTRYRKAKVIDTAPTWHQVASLFWGELHKAVASARVRYPALNETSLVLARGERYIEGLSTTESEKFQGAHAAEGGHVLIIVDEAPGVKPAIWEAIDSIRAGGDVRVLALGNPTIAGGPFYDAFTTNRAGWQTYTIGAFDTPNLRGFTLDHLLAMDEAALDDNVRPYLISRRWVRERHAEWGRGHPLWESRVLGQFPTQSDTALIPLAWIERARYADADVLQELTVGVDVAGPGEDETVVVIRGGRKVLGMWATGAPDPRGFVAEKLAPHKDRIDVINVDSNGIGWGMYLHLRDLGYNARPVNVGERPSSDSAREKYVNLKAELYWGMRMRFEANDIAGDFDETTVAQLTAIQYEHNARGQVVIESKEDMRKRGVKSPDRAEALMLACAFDRQSSSFEALQRMFRQQDDRRVSIAELDALEDERGQTDNFWQREF